MGDLTLSKPDRRQGEQPLRQALGQQLVDSGTLSAAALERAERLVEETGERLELVLTRLALVADRDLTNALAQLLHLPTAASSDYPKEPILDDTISRRFLEEMQLLPLSESAEGIAIAMVNPLDTYVVEAVRFATGKPVFCYVAFPADFEAAYERLYGDGKSELDQLADIAGGRPDASMSDDVERLADGASEAPVIRLVNLLITKAAEMRASDIHIEPMGGELRVRYRIDGVLHEVESPPQRLSAAMISRIKIMARLNIAERRLAQDGRIKLAVRGNDLDFRVSTSPTMHGESVVLRILDRSNLPLDFASLGFEDDIAKTLREILSRPHGILLATGPTGSGKTTTLYTALLELNTPDRKILTIEDPIEYQLRGINQVQVKPQIGLTFASALRSFLRQDPDIMMVGEIRDLETAQIAIQAALTGHLILSSLHTNDSAGAITRLLDMGVEDYLLTSTINGIVAQRLVRTLCTNCREPHRALPEFLERLRLPKIDTSAATVLYRPRGCEHCSGTGYFGRTSIIEVLVMSDAIRQHILRHADASLIREAAVAEGMQTMSQHGMKKALRGITSADEVIRVTHLGT